MKRIEKYMAEKEILSANYGELTKDTMIRVELYELGQMITRPYLQASSYEGLINYIARTTGATITITSQRTSKAEDKE